jgi:hypothetical protein
MMSTRAAIGCIYDDGYIDGVKTIYNHYDGYPSHVGKLLKEYHASNQAVLNLLVGSHIRNFDHDGTVVRFADGDGAAEVWESKEEAIDGFDYLYLWSFEKQKWECFANESTGLREIEL